MRATTLDKGRRLKGRAGTDPASKAASAAWMLTMSLVLAIAGPLLAPREVSADVRKPDGSPVDPDRLPVLRDQRRDPLRVRIINGGMKPTELPRPSGAGNLETGDRLDFLQTFTCSMTVDGDGGTYYLLIEIYPNQKVRDVVGWVHSRYLLTTTHAEEDPATKLHKKAMIVNSIDDIADDVRRAKTDADARFGSVAPRLGPSASAAPAGEEIRLFNLFFIYGQADDYILLGRSPEFNPAIGEEEARRVMVGWLPKARVSQWLTRESLYWAPRQAGQPARDTPGIVYASARDAASALRSRPSHVVTSERPASSGSGGFGKPITSQQMRFPLLKGKDPDDPTPMKLDGNEMLRIGAFGDFVARVGDQQRVQLTEDKLLEIQRSMTQTRREMRRVELVFVVDETGSIKKGGWFPIIARTIDRIIAPLREAGRQGQGPEIRIAVSFYGDTYGGSEPATPSRLVGSTEFEPILRDLPNHRGQDNPDDDARERVFYGLGQAIDLAGFSKLSRKMVILFGDFGNKPNIAGDPSASDLIEKLVPDDTAISPTEFYAVQVGNADKFVEGMEFRDQMRNISDRVSAKIKNRYRDDPTAGSLSEFVNVSTPAEAGPVIDSIVGRYAMLRQKALKANDEIDAFRLTFGNAISRETEEALKSRNVPIEELRKMPGAQLYQPGFVWRENAKGVTQVRQYLLASEGELARFIERTAGLDLQPGQAGWTSVEEFIRKMIQVMGGELSTDYRSRSLNEIVRQATGFTFRNPLFDRIVGDISNATLNSQEMADIRWKRSVLADVLQAKKCEYISQKVPGGGGFEWIEHVKSTKAPQYISRGFYFPGDDSIKWYWIDFEEEWP